MTRIAPPLLAQHRPSAPSHSLRCRTKHLFPNILIEIIWKALAKPIHATHCLASPRPSLRSPSVPIPAHPCRIYLFPESRSRDSGKTLAFPREAIPCRASRSNAMPSIDSPSNAPPRRAKSQFATNPLNSYLPKNGLKVPNPSVPPIWKDCLRFSRVQYLFS